MHKMAPKGPVLPIEDRIERNYERLPKSEQRIADLILDFPGDLAGYSATELAVLAETSQAAVTRLIRRLGFRNYGEARRAARDAQSWGSPLYLHTQRPSSGDAKSPAEIQLKRDLQILTETLAGLDAVPIDQIAEAIVAAKRVFLLGLRNNQFMAAYAHWQLVQIRGDVHLLPRAGRTLAEYFADLTSDDFLLIVGVRRRPAILNRAMEVAQDAGAPILYITDPTAMRSVHRATWTIRIPVRSASLFDSYVGVISVLHLLSSAVVERSGPAGRKQLKRIEKIHELLEEFD